MPSGPSSLDALFSPRRVAVVGASRRPGKLGHDVLVECAARGFEGEMFGVNPNGDGAPVAGWPVHRSLGDAGGDVDLALVAVSAEATPQAVAACAAGGVRVAVLAAAGLGELGGAGADAEAEMARLARKAGMRLVGPNGFGLFVGPRGLNLMAWRDVPEGRVALVTQSGNVAIAVSRLCAKAGIGLSVCVGVGNQLDVSAGELVGYLADSPDCDAIALYVEGLRGSVGRELASSLRACAEAGKPVVVLKGGQSAAGVAATATHTGALGGDGRVWDAVINRSGGIRVASTEEMVDALLAIGALRAAPTGPAAGALLLTDGGGDSVLMLDALGEAAIPLARLSPETQSELEAQTPAAAPRAPGRNPVTLDTAGGLEDDPRLLARCAEIGASDEAVGIVVVSGTFGGYRQRRAEELEAVERLVRLHATGTPVIAHSAFALDDEEPVRRLRDAGVPVYPTARRLALGLARAGWPPAGPAPEGPAPEEPVEPDRARPGAALAGSALPGSGRPGTRPGILPVSETAKLLGSAGVALPPLQVVSSLDELHAVARSTTVPACLKVDDPRVAHKSEAGAVLLGLDRDEIVPAAAGLWRRFPEASLVVMPMLSPGIELLVGAAQDPTFGPFIIVGRGGVTAELDPDVAVALAPVTKVDACSLWLSLRCGPLLAGWRSQAPVDVDALAELAAGIGDLAVGDPSLSIECNPVFAYGTGYAVADLRATRDEVSDAGP